MGATLKRLFIDEPFIAALEGESIISESITSAELEVSGEFELFGGSTYDWNDTSSAFERSDVGDDLRAGSIAPIDHSRRPARSDQIARKSIRRVKAASIGRQSRPTHFLVETKLNEPVRLTAVVRPAWAVGRSTAGVAVIELSGSVLHFEF